MPALWLDYRRTRRGADWRDAIALALAVLVAVYVGAHYIAVARETDRLETQRLAFAHQNRSVGNSRLATLSPQQLRAEVKQANTILAQLALPWDTLFKDLESAPADQIALLSIEPDAEKHTVKIVGEAKSLATMLSYLQSLQQKPSLSQVYLQNHRIEHVSGENPIRFTLLASWVIKP